MRCSRSCPRTRRRSHRRCLRSPCASGPPTRPRRRGEEGRRMTRGRGWSPAFRRSSDGEEIPPEGGTPTGFACAPNSLARRGRRLGHRREVRVEDADFLPVLLVLLDELQVPGVVLVLVVGGL